MTLEVLQKPAKAVAEEFDEVLVYIERHMLYGKAIGYVDVHLLASAAIGGAQLWTRDKRLRAVPRGLGYAVPDASAH